jgi:hypothetical protein
MYEIGAALAGIKTFTELTTLILKAKVDSAVREKAIESQAAVISLQTSMMTLQSQYQSLLREKDELEKRLVEIEDWKVEAAKYSLKELVPGALVYAPNSDAGDTAPEHWLCTRCYQERKKSILQRTIMPRVYVCPACQTTVTTRGR